jgi:hypothetical protein
MAKVNVKLPEPFVQIINHRYYKIARVAKHSDCQETGRFGSVHRCPHCNTRLTKEKTDLKYRRCSCGRYYKIIGKGYIWEIKITEIDEFAFQRSLQQALEQSLATA